MKRLTNFFLLLLLSCSLFAQTESESGTRKTKNGSVYKIVVDDSGHLGTILISGPGAGGGGQTGDVTAPTITTIQTNSATVIRAVFNESVTATGSGFSFVKNGTPFTASGVSGAGNTWNFTVPVIVYGDVLTVSYNPATGNTIDAAGNELASFSGRTVVNNVAYVDPGGGSGGTFTASTVSGLVAWHDATDAATMLPYNGKVAYLLDKVSGGNTNNMEQPNVNDMATYVTDGSGINGKNYIKMDATKALKVLSLNLPQPYTVFIVYKYRSGNGWMVTMNAARSNNIMMINTTFGAAELDKYYTMTLSGGSAQYSRRENNLDPNLVQIWRGAWDGDSSSTRVNREPASPRNFTGGGTAAMENFAVNAEGLAIDYYESLIYNHRLTKAEEKAVNDYLYNKYQVPNKPYIAFTGNSITEGIGAATAAEQYTWLVASELGMRHYNYGISGAGIYSSPGFTNKGWNSQIDNAIGFNNSGYLFSTIGYNNDRSANPTQWKADYKAKIVQAINSGYAANRIYLFSPIYSLTGYGGDDASRLAMRDDIQAIASELGTNFGDLWSYSKAHASEYTMPDGIHPGSTGHRLIANFQKSVFAGTPLSLNYRRLQSEQIINTAFAKKPAFSYAE